MYKYIKRYSDLVFPATAFIYVVGFVITNSNLTSYGISYLNIFKFKYLAAGLLFIVLQLLALIILYPFFYRIDPAKDIFKENEFSQNTGPGPGLKYEVAGFCSVFFLNAFFNGRIDTTGLPQFLYYWLSIYAVLILTGILIEIRLASPISVEGESRVAKFLEGLRILNERIADRRYRKHQFLNMVMYAWLIYAFFTHLKYTWPLLGIVFVIDREMAQIQRAKEFSTTLGKYLTSPGVISHTFISFIIILFSLVSFGQVTYKQVKPEYGGGMPADVLITFKDARKPFKATLIDQTDSDIFVIENENKTLQINKSEISLIETSINSDR